jgi:hypothetical protein
MRLNLGDVWHRPFGDEWTVEQLAQELAKRIRRLPCFRKAHRLHDWAYSFEEIADEFDCVTETDEFDYWMQELYDLGDVKLDNDWNGKKLCWIDTMKRAA